VYSSLSGLTPKQTLPNGTTHSNHTQGYLFTRINAFSSRGTADFGLAWMGGLEKGKLVVAALVTLTAAALYPLAGLPLQSRHIRVSVCC
jgi:hypothetical protein